MNSSSGSPFPLSSLNLPHKCSPPPHAACLRNSLAHPLWHDADRRRRDAASAAAVAPLCPRSVSRHRAAAVHAPCCDRQRAHLAPSSFPSPVVARSQPQPRRVCCKCSGSVCHRPELSRLLSPSGEAVPRVRLVDCQRRSPHRLWPMSWCCESLWQLLPAT